MSIYTITKKFAIKSGLETYQSEFSELISHVNLKEHMLMFSIETRMIYIDQYAVMQFRKNHLMQYIKPAKNGIYTSLVNPYPEDMDAKFIANYLANRGIVLHAVECGAHFHLCCPDTGFPVVKIGNTVQIAKIKNSIVITDIILLIWYIRGKTTHLSDEGMTLSKAVEMYRTAPKEVDTAEEVKPKEPISAEMIINAINCLSPRDISPYHLMTGAAQMLAEKIKGCSKENIRYTLINTIIGILPSENVTDQGLYAIAYALVIIRRCHLEDAVTDVYAFRNGLLYLDDNLVKIGEKTIPTTIEFVTVTMARAYCLGIPMI